MASIFNRLRPRRGATSTSSPCSWETSCCFSFAASETCDLVLAALDCGSAGSPAFAFWACFFGLPLLRFTGAVWACDGVTSPSGTSEADVVASVGAAGLEVCLFWASSSRALSDSRPFISGASDSNSSMSCSSLNAKARFLPLCPSCLGFRPRLRAMMALLGLATASSESPSTGISASTSDEALVIFEEALVIFELRRLERGCGLSSKREEDNGGPSDLLGEDPSEVLIGDRARGGGRCTLLALSSTVGSAIVPRMTLETFGPTIVNNYLYAQCPFPRRSRLCFH